MTYTLPAVSLHQPWATLCVTRTACSRCEGWIPHPADTSSSRAGCPECGEKDRPMVKRYETRTRKPPSTIVGKRVLIHAAKKRPPWTLRVGGYSHGERSRVSVQDLVHSDPCDCDEDEEIVGRRCMSLNDSDPWLFTEDGSFTVEVGPMPLGAIVGSAIIGEGIPILDHSPDDLDDVMVLYPGHSLRRVTRAHHAAHAWNLDHSVADQEPYGDWTSGRWAWPLTDARPLPEPIPWKGRQGVFYVPAEAVPS